ncbi:MAG: hypothetical protein OXG91_07205 [bacterium]|nr:hypothetical protein [bacterium]
MTLLDGYRRRTSETNCGVASSECLFRTPEELAYRAHQRGFQPQPA